MPDFRVSARKRAVANRITPTSQHEDRRAGNSASAEVATGVLISRRFSQRGVNIDRMETNASTPVAD
jgi:hypothetical protein